MRGGGHLGHPGEQKLRHRGTQRRTSRVGIAADQRLFAETYRLRVERDGSNALLITRDGYDWTKRFP